MKKSTKKEWMAYHTEMHILAKAAHNPYVFDPKTKVQFAAPKSLRVALDHVINHNQGESS
jgi:hypothetical protein